MTRPPLILLLHTCSPSQAGQGTGQGTHWTVCQTITGPTFIHTLTLSKQEDPGQTHVTRGAHANSTRTERMWDLNQQPCKCDAMVPTSKAPRSPFTVFDKSGNVKYDEIIFRNGYKMNVLTYHGKGHGEGRQVPAVGVPITGPRCRDGFRAGSPG